MATVMRNLIQYSGIDTCNYTNGTFKQFNVDNTFCVAVIKPDIEQIIKVWANAKICNYKIIKTPKGKSLEGQTLTGYKLIIMGEVEMKYEYVALEKEQSTHISHNVIPFCEYVVMPKEFNPISLTSPTILIEDIHSEQLSNRCIYSNITMMLNADIC